MRILVIADIHGKYEMLQNIMDSVTAEKFDALISPGDFTDMFDNTADFTQMELADIVLQKLMIPGKPLLCVPGNHDPYEILDIFEEYGVNLHNKVKKLGGVPFVGWGGADTPFNTMFEPSDDETREAISLLSRKLKGGWVLVTHAPPKGTKLDVVGGKKHVGSGAVMEMIKEKKPTLAITAHIHENRGEYMVGKTHVFYPGPAYNGFYGFVTIDKSGVKCESKRAGKPVR